MDEKQFEGVLRLPIPAGPVPVTVLDTIAATLGALPEGTRCVVIEPGGAELWEGTEPPQHGTPAAARAWLDSVSGCLARMERLEVPVVVAVRGRCIGVGLELVLAADVVVADRRATFGFGRDGVGVPLVAVQRHGSWGRDHLFAQLALSGGTVDASTAYAALLVDLVTDDLDGEVERVAARLASAAPLSMALARRLLHRGAAADIDAAAPEIPLVGGRRAV